MEKRRALIEKQLLTTLRDFLKEGGRERGARSVSMEALLERELGIGSLEKAELFHRIEQNFGIHLSQTALTQTKTVQDLFYAILEAHPPQKMVLEQSIEPLEALDLDVSLSQTLTEVLQGYAMAEPERPHIYLQDEAACEQILTYGALWQRANAIAQGLRKYGLGMGETVGLMLPTSFEFFEVFFGILAAGGIPVPLYPPFQPHRMEEYAKREASILNNAEIRFLFTPPHTEVLSALLRAFVSGLKETLTPDMCLHPIENKALLPKLESEDGALIQYTSGSTGSPKGVLLTHANLLANIRAFGAAMHIHPDDVVVSWLPLYHDMGLIGTWLGSLYYGIPLTVMSPLSFLTRPERWLWAIHYHRATISAGPNFAYELCLNKIEDSSIEGLDLSSWRLACNGAEAVYPKTMARFTERFKPYGFNPKSFCPVYGLAEASVGLTFSEINRIPRIDRILRAPFEKERRAIPAGNNTTDFLEFVSCGQALPEHTIRIVDEQDHVVPERTVGCLQFAGPSVMQGYYRNPEATRLFFHGGFGDSGDFAYMADQEVFITGRKKDLIIKAGRNVYPEEIEAITSEIPGVRKGCVIAFGVQDLKKGTEKLVIAAETKVRESSQHKIIIASILEKVTDGIGLPPDEVILLKPGMIPKTSSGKLKRSLCKRMYQKKQLTHERLPVFLQIIKLFLEGFRKKCTRGLVKLLKCIYTAYGFVLSLLTLGPLWLCALCAPPRVIFLLSQGWARWFFRLIFCPIKIVGKTHLYSTTPKVMIANHASYIDALVLLAVLPKACCFVGKKELMQVPFLRTFLKKIDFIAIDRLDLMQSLADIQTVAQKLKMGHSLVIFPEGTFTYATGLRPFKYGAFKLSVDLGIPLLPIALQGTRSILRAGSSLLSPGKITVTIQSPLFPKDHGWHEMTRLLRSARLMIAQHCGEPVLDLVAAGVAVPHS